MIERNSLYHIEFYKHTYFSGSYEGMRYRIEKHSEEASDDQLLATVFPGPYGFEATPEEKRTTKLFPYSDEGLTEICDWLNSTYEASPEDWALGKRIR